MLLSHHKSSSVYKLPEDTIKSKVLFAGTSEFAIPTLEKLICQPDIEIRAVLTQPDRKRAVVENLN
tara:strand:+ start:1275 stop:1472 length:198 start_codon:yes stop_codon:yes gene_type:complete